MTGFNLDFSKAQQGNEIKDGTYEVVVNKAVENATKSGAEFIDIDLIVRNDVDQPFQNKHIFAKIWKAKATGKYNEGMIMAIAQALQLEDGKSYNGLDELLADFVLKTASVRVKTEESNGYKNVNVKSWDKTNTRGVMNHQFKNGDEPSFGPERSRATTVRNDNLPF
ncbi:DUF669 domain-containing protein [Enterococcus faecium]|uniref:DUF669 domain-containing protein n=1 Tax=Enterococcus faecium TaxID=1352 RepID=UPI0018C28AC9|nr:DUF669 domain-containing protein [Enterococcus faecium]MBG0387944.1 DUF669 domain-containing protein [Enterococcus faecium]MDT0237137.1 DUF669 domain-containing protein [Enterococcus faecium]MDT0241588.1 DUF669 domain-containing protein [Enterococcus faecium]MDT0246288.1 DUF669 domain-containing protein [Enterococcus faecium]MDT6271781.1 DUF669 domain-containing protein [Enterococcus faecium]